LISEVSVCFHRAMGSVRERVRAVARQSLLVLQRIVLLVNLAEEDDDRDLNVVELVAAHKIRPERVTDAALASARVVLETQKELDKTNAPLVKDWYVSACW
jgi:hypothetical protein